LCSSNGFVFGFVWLTVRAGYQDCREHVRAVGAHRCQLSRAQASLTSPGQVTRRARAQLCALLVQRVSAADRICECYTSVPELVSRSPSASVPNAWFAGRPLSWLSAGHSGP
jgi:hypothetical protein